MLVLCLAYKFCFEFKVIGTVFSLLLICVIYIVFSYFSSFVIIFIVSSLHTFDYILVFMTWCERYGFCYFDLLLGVVLVLWNFWYCGHAWQTFTLCFTIPVSTCWQYHFSFVHCFLSSVLPYKSFSSLPVLGSFSVSWKIILFLQYNVRFFKIFVICSFAIFCVDAFLKLISGHIELLY